MSDGPIAPPSVDPGLPKTAPAGRSRRLLHILAVVALFLVSDFLFTGIFTINQDEQGVVLRFGGVHRRLGPGIHFILPWPIERLEKVNTAETRKMPVGFRLAVGVDPTPPGLDESEWLTGDTNVIDIAMMIHYVISGPELYLYNVGPGEADFLIRKCAESVLTRKIATMPVDDVFTTGKLEIEEATRKGTQTLLDKIEAGITILSANLRAVSPPMDVKEAFNDVSRAKADMERLIKEADGYVNEIIPDAKATANDTIQKARIYESRVINDARGRAERFTVLQVEYALSREITRQRLFLDMIEKVMEKTEKVVVTLDENGKAEVHLVR